MDEVRIMRKTLASASLLATLAIPASALAQYPVGAYGQPVYAQPVNGPMVYGQVIAPTPGAPMPPVATLPPQPVAVVRSRARFNIGRFFLESIVGGLAGAGAGYGVLRVSCGERICLGGAIGGLLTNVAVTPVAVWLLGMATGGEGNIGSAYYGAAIGVGAGGAGFAVDPGVALAIGTTLMPFTSALLYEFNSNARAQEQENAQGVRVQSLQVSPLGSPSGALAGLSLDVGGRF